MLERETNVAKIARNLLEHQAFRVNPETPYTWASGWRSPVYCDNRRLLSVPEARKAVVEALIELIVTSGQRPEGIVGVATGGIAWAAWLAEHFDLPLLYVRAEAKNHGLGQQVEGILKSAQQVWVIEDLVSTGKSSIQAIHALRQAGLDILGLSCVFTYKFQQALELFRSENVFFSSACDLPRILSHGIETGHWSEAEQRMIDQWRANPSTWS